ncbi:molybdopterin-dependent oxidoreductase, partial [Oleiphilus sp. HI0066]
IGKEGCGPFSITGQPNAMGGREVGGLANLLAAHMDIDNAEHRALVQEYWSCPTIVESHGHKAVDLFQKIESGDVKAVWVMATNPVVSLPNRLQIESALKKCDFVVVSDYVSSNDTLPFADVKLPATSWSEKDGTVTNSERTISRQRAFLPPLGEAKHDWRIICDVAIAMGFDGFDFASQH